jgi:hypothetical protein
VEVAVRPPGPQESSLDFLSPSAGCSRSVSRLTPERLILEDTITMVSRPLGFLDRLPTSHHASRSSGASAAASDVGRFARYKDALFANPPEEGGPPG